MTLAAFAVVVNQDGRSAHTHMPLAERRDAEAVILFRVRGAADAKELEVDQSKDARDDTIAADLGPSEVSIDSGAQFGQESSKFERAVELLTVASMTPCGAVDALCPPCIIDASRQHLGSRGSSDLDVSPGGGGTASDSSRSSSSAAVTRLPLRR